MSLRAKRKAAARKFNVGDVVTWGKGVSAHLVTAKRPDGVVVDSAATGFPDYFVPYIGSDLRPSRKRPT